MQLRKATRIRFIITKPLNLLLPLIGNGIILFDQLLRSWPDALNGELPSQKLNLHNGFLYTSSFFHRHAYQITKSRAAHSTTTKASRQDGRQIVANDHRNRHDGRYQIRPTIRFDVKNLSRKIMPIGICKKMAAPSNSPSDICAPLDVIASISSRKPVRANSCNIAE